MIFLRVFFGAFLLFSGYGAAMQAPLSASDLVVEEVLEHLREVQWYRARRCFGQHPELTAQHFAEAMDVLDFHSFFLMVPAFQLGDQGQFEDMLRALEGESPVREALHGIDSPLQLIWRTLWSEPFETVSTVEIYFVLKVLRQWLNTGFLGASKEVSLLLASYYGHTQNVALLLADPDVDPSANNNYAIRFACANGHVGAVELLLGDSRVDPGAAANSAIRQASGRGYAEIVALLLKSPRVDAGALNDWAIIKASEAGHAAVVRLLLANSRVSPATEANIALVSALSSGNVPVATLLYGDPRIFKTFHVSQVPANSVAQDCFSRARLAKFMSLLLKQEGTKLGELLPEVLAEIVKAAIGSELSQDGAFGLMHSQNK